MVFSAVCEIKVNKRLIRYSWGLIKSTCLFELRVETLDFYQTGFFKHLSLAFDIYYSFIFTLLVALLY